MGERAREGEDGRDDRKRESARVGGRVEFARGSVVSRLAGAAGTGGARGPSGGAQPAWVGGRRCGRAAVGRAAGRVSFFFFFSFFQLQIEVKP